MAGEQPLKELPRPRALGVGKQDGGGGLLDDLPVDISTPHRETLPLSIPSRRQMHLASVLLPEPLGPIADTTSPSFTSRSMPFRTALPS
jgi:hypothetical protein